MTKSWGYTILSERSFNFYLQKPYSINIKQVALELDAFREICVQPNGSINIYTQEEWLRPTIRNIARLARRIDKSKRVK